MAHALQARNPRTGELDFSFTGTSEAALEDMAVRARAAQKDWGALTLAARGERLARFADILETEVEAIASALEIDTGRRRIAQMEVAGVVASIRGWVSQAHSLLPDGWTQGRSAPHIKHKAQFVPHALVGVIAPWNFPLTLSMIDTVPALLAGCAVILKPSEVTPRFAVPLADAIEASGFADLFQIAQGDGATGATLCNTSDAICFTGSVPTGRKVAAACASNMIPAFLELGGKDPLIITKSAQLDLAIRAALRSSVLSTGQACQSIERIYVAREIYDAFLDGLCEAASAVELNWPDISKGTLGPIIFEQQAALLADHIADAIAQGARILTGGEIENHGGGKWLRPTVIADATHKMKVIREESFGPLLPIIAFDTIEQAVALANDTEFGLSAAVIAGTLEEAEEVGAQIDAGAISLNDAALTALFHEAEKHSFKLSGLGGSRMGPAGFQRFLRRKALIANMGEPAPLSAFAEDA